MLAERDDPRAAFAGHRPETPWDELHVAYFSGYAMWNYLTSPFLFTRPGCAVEEIEPWPEDGQAWRRPRVEYPGDIATHNRVQEFYFDGSGLLRRHDYTADGRGRWSWRALVVGVGGGGRWWWRALVVAGVGGGTPRVGLAHGFWCWRSVSDVAHEF